MYKTIRHGENSLQYTILPQHDDYSKGGGGVGASGSGAQSSLGPEALGIGAGGVTIVRSKKRSWLTYVGLFFVCSIITGAILVPLLVSVEVLSGPKEWFYRHTGQRLGAYKPATNAAKVLASGGVSSAYRHDPKPHQVNRTDATKIVDLPVLGDELSDEEDIAHEESTTRTNSVLKQISVNPSAIPDVVSDKPLEPVTVQTTSKAPPTQSITTTAAPQAQTTAQYKSYDETIALTEKPTTLKPGRKLRKPKISRPNLIPVTVPVTPVTLDLDASMPVVSSTQPLMPKRNWIDSHTWKSYNTTVPVYGSSIQPLAILCSATAGMCLTIVCFLLIKKCSTNKQKRVDLLTVEAQNGDNTTLLTNEEEDDDMTEDE